MATERLYYNDCYRAVFDAAITGISDDRRHVRLERTAFYPASGGQGRDFGALNGIEVIDLVDTDGDIEHVLAEPMGAGEQVARGTINWARRYDHMQQHTGQHLLSAIFVEQLGYATLSFHMGEECSTIELGTVALSEADIERVEKRANELAWTSAPVTIAYQEANAAAGLRKASEREGMLRIVEIAGIDRSACGGTHVRSTAELTPIQVRASEKIRGNTRIEFVCGGRAVAQAKTDYRILVEVARSLGCPLTAVPEGVLKFRERAVEAEKENKRLSTEAARTEAANIFQRESTTQDLNFIVLERMSIDDYARNLASALTGFERTAIVIRSAKDTGIILFAASNESGLHAGNLLRPLLAKYGGKGGGSAASAQGSIPDAKNVPRLIEELQAACQGATKHAGAK